MLPAFSCNLSLTKPPEPRPTPMPFDATLPLENKALSRDAFEQEREQTLGGWPTGADVNFEEGVRYQLDLPPEKRFSEAMRKADETGATLLQPRAGVALLQEQIELLTGLQDVCDVLPTTIDAYTRHNRYQEADVGIARSREAGRSLMNGFPAVNHGLRGCRELVEALSKPVQVRHGTPDARLLAEITLAAGFTSYEGGGICYNIPYAKSVPLARSIRHWQYCDRLVGLYEEAGVRINREPFGPLTGTLVPPFVSHCVMILEGLLALEQGVRCITLGYGQAGNLVQDIAAIRSLRELGEEFFSAAGYEGYQLSTVFHQWMGGFPEEESKAYGVICLGAAAASLAGATKVIVKTPHEAEGVPTLAANRDGLKATRQMINMLSEQVKPTSAEIELETDMIKREVRAVLSKVFELGEGNIAVGTVRAFESGVMDIPFAPAQANAGVLMPVRDDHGALRVLEKGNSPLPDDVLAFHRDKIDERARSEGREASFKMVVDDVNAISDGRLVGRPK
ncbi:methylaspartate mutase subunit E [Marinobacter subterrani]|uniref:Glutamate mutase epsilon subunit n=1 Tax=Marinobacter subterrani TaxID=1658765 RepID=A0A0J7JBW9_9GAMM|nr:methylaspartate mutase subunit E [Marinobacter subterrani]KMQ75983.1 Glutamate mutase subunit E [Marinobacter subterrani]